MKLTTITGLKDYPVPSVLQDHLVQVGPRVENYIDVYLDGVEVGTIRYERSSPFVPRTHGGALRTGKSAISRWYVGTRTYYSRAEAAWAVAKEALPAAAPTED